MGLGRNRNVYAERLIFFFDEVACVYPAQNLDRLRFEPGTETTWVTEPFYTDVEANGYYIERNAGDFFGSPDSEERFSTYWSALKDANQNKVGVIGLQLSQDKFFELLPSTVLEEPYQLSFMTILSNQTDENGDKKRIWSYYESEMDESEWESILGKIQVNI